MRRTSTTCPATAWASSRRTRSSAANGYRLGDVVIAHALVGPALQRLLAGAPRAAGRRAGMRLDSVIDDLGASAHARRGAAHADPDLRAGLPRPDRRVRGARVRPRHRRRHPRQPRPRAAATTWTRSSTARPGARSPSSTSCRARAASTHRRWRRRSTWASACSPSSRPSDADRAMAVLTARGIESWSVGEVIEGEGNVRMLGSHTRG